MRRSATLVVWLIACCWVVAELELPRKRRESSSASLARSSGGAASYNHGACFLTSNTSTARFTCFAAASVVLRWLKRMHRSIELGRAVLSAPAVNLELWLKTLITVSPQQQCTDFKQQNAASLLDTLSSGQVWVGRGNRLYIDLDITLQGQPATNNQLRQLSEAVLSAPVSVRHPSSLQVLKRHV